MDTKLTFMNIKQLSVIGFISMFHNYLKPVVSNYIVNVYNNLITF